MAHIAYIGTPKFCVEKKISKTPMRNMHYHHSVELYYILKGEREYFVGDQFFKMEEGDLILIPDGNLHRTAGKSASCFLINFSAEYLGTYFTPETVSSLQIKHPVVFRPNQVQKDTLDSLCNSLYSEYTRILKDDGCLDSAILAGYLYQILFTISFGANGYVQENYSDRRISGIVKYINENYSSINSIEEIAEQFYISKYHLCRLFNQNLGVGLITYLNTIKIRKASELLKEDSKSITDIAMECGFNSSSYFCKVFKSEKGLSPTDYKKQYKARRNK